MSPAPQHPHERRRLTPSRPEQEFQDKVIEYCRWLKLYVYHPYDSRRSSAGFPDLTIVGNRVLFVELKSEKGTLSIDQQIVHDRIRKAAGDAAIEVWRPSDWDHAQQVLQGMR